MEKLNNQRLDNLKQTLKLYEDEISISIIEQQNYIIEVGFLTVTVDKNDLVQLQNTKFPTQFSQNAINEILKINFRNKDNQLVIPKVFSKNEWYYQRINDMRDILKLFENNQ